jgi:hypothetical protein
VVAVGHDSGEGNWFDGGALASVKLRSSVAGTVPVAIAVARGGPDGANARAEATSTAANGSATAYSEAVAALGFREHYSPGYAQAVSHARGSGVARSSAAGSGGSESRSDALGPLGVEVAAWTSGAPQTRSSASFGALGAPVVPVFADPMGGGAEGQSDVDGALTAAVIGDLLEGHANVGAAVAASGLGVVAAGNMGTSVPYGVYGVEYYSAGAALRFTLRAPSQVLLGLLDFGGQGGTAICNDEACSNPDFDLAYTLRVSNFGAPLLEQSFSTLSGISAYFSDQALDLGRFSGAVDLSIELYNHGFYEYPQAAYFSYLLATGPLRSAVPEPGLWALLLLGLGVIGALRRHDRARTV